VLLAALASWPFLETLAYWPMTADPPVWIGRGTPLSADWLSWVFAGDHFSWYRPLTALTFALDQAVGGVDPRVFRATDLGLHLGVGLLACAVYTRWSRRSPSWAGVFVAAIVWTHPLAEEVVPYMARRSYSLAMCLGLAALWLLAGGVERVRGGAPGRAASLGVGGLLVLALLSNEAALTVVLIVPLLVAAGLRGRERACSEGLRLLLPAALLVAVAMALRCWVLGGLGGYGELAQQRQAPSEVLPPLWASVTGFRAAWTLVLAVPVGAYFLWAALGGLRPGPLASGSLRSGAAPERQLVLVGVLWIALAGLLYVAAGIYTPRQAYGLQVPLAFAVVGAWCTRGGWLGALAPAVLLGVLLSSAPVVRGQQPNRLRGWAERQALLEAVIEDLEACETPAVVRLVLPNMRPQAPLGTDGARVILHRSIRQPVSWAEVALRGRALSLRDFLYYPRDGGPVRLEHRDQRPCLVLPPGGPLLQRRGQDFIEAPAGEVLWLDGLSWPAGSHGYLYLYGPAGGQLLRLHAAGS